MERSRMQGGERDDSRSNGSHPARLLLLFLSPFLLCACLFDLDLDRESTSSPAGVPFDFAKLKQAPNPFALRYPEAAGKNLVGVKFAFRSMEYEQEVAANIEAFALEAGGRPALAGAYFDLSSQPKNIARFLASVQGQGAIPFVTLDPKDWDQPDTAYQRTFLSLILSGQFDSSLQAQAQAFKEFGEPILFRFGHEMNGNWYPYSGAFAGGKADSNRNGQSDGPETYILAWRHAHRLFQDAGADNLLWVYCPNAESIPDEEWNGPFQYYPGSDYVDFVSADTYESPEKGLHDLEEVLEGFYQEYGLFLQSRSKDTGSAIEPFGISEFGTSRTDPGRKGDWYARGIQGLGADDRITFSVLYNGRNGMQDFSITGLGTRLRNAYAHAAFLFRLSPRVAGQ